MSAGWKLGLKGWRWGLAVAGATVLLGLALMVDRPVSAWMQGWPAPLRGALAVVTTLGESGLVLYPAAALFVAMAALALFVRWALMRTLLRQLATLYAFIFAGVGLPVLATALAKRLIGRGRPELFESGGVLSFQPNWIDWSHQSFPSGHATTAFALAVVLGFLAPRWFAPALVLAVLVGVSRIALGAHYPSDVLAGALIGGLGAYAARALFAGCGWLFRRDGAGRIATRPLAALARYVALKRRDSARGRRRDRP